MSEQNIYSPSYWRKRLDSAINNGNIHKAVFEVGLDRWETIRDLHKNALLYILDPQQSVLDVGCGYGGILEVTPAHWEGDYYGIDLSPDFVHYAREQHPDKRFKFFVGDFRDPRALEFDRTFDWGLVSGTRPMIIGHSGQEQWDAIESYIFKSVTRGIIYLEYDETAPTRIVEIKKKP